MRYFLGTLTDMGPIHWVGVQNLKSKSDTITDYPAKMIVPFHCGELETQVGSFKFF